MIVDNFTFIVLSFDQDAILLVTRNADILHDFCLTEEILIGATNYPIDAIFINLVQSNKGKGTIDLYSFLILRNQISIDFWLACQSNLNSYLILADTVTNNLQFKLFTNQSDAFWIVLYDVLDDLAVISLYTPYDYPSLPMISDFAILEIQITQLTHDSNSILALVSLDLWIWHVQIAIFLHPNGRYGRITGLYYIV